ncbi:MAG: very short patch repair endonuclease [Chloroflexota bacterium]
MESGSSDVFDKAKRSEIMSKVRSRKNKSTELKFLDYLKVRKITGWRRHFAVPGTPDFAFRKEKIAIFLDGCFWHGHDCRNTTPRANKEYWDAKIARNRARDLLVDETLRGKGWSVLRIWECKLKSKEYLDETVLELIMTKREKDI